MSGIFISRKNRTKIVPLMIDRDTLDALNNLWALEDSGYWLLENTGYWELET